MTLGINSVTELVGHIAGLWRYPVKSMQGEALDALEVEARGVVADRLYAIRNSAGKFGSGKNTRRFQRIDGLLGFQSRLDNGVPVLTSPDRRVMRCDDPAIHDELSKALGEPVTLAKEAEIQHFDEGAIHLMFSSGLNWIRGQVPEADVDVRQFRPNLLVATHEAGFEETDLIDKIITVGSKVRLRMSHRTTRCVIITQRIDGSSAEPQILRAIAQHRDACLGLYANVVQTGRISLGDEIRVEASI